MKGMFNFKTVDCYGKSYQSRKAFAEDFGVANKYSQICALLNKGFTPEHTIEIVIDNKYQEANLLLEEKTPVEIYNDIFNGSVTDISNTKKRNKDFTKKIKKIETDKRCESVVNNLPEENTINTSHITYDPLYFEIQSLPQLISEMGKVVAHNINLIDYENVVEQQDLLKEEICKPDTLNIFFYNACHYSNQFFRIIKCTNNINLQVLTHNDGNQLVDHLITFYLGALFSAYPDKQYNIISRDTGFCPFVGAIRKSNISTIGSKFISDKEDRFKYSMFKYIRNTKLVNRDRILKSEFKDIFEGFCKDSSLLDKEIDRYITKLQNWGVLEVMHRGEFEYYKFDMEEIAKFVDSI